MGCSGSPGSHTRIKVPQDTPETLILIFLPWALAVAQEKGSLQQPLPE